MNFDPSFLFDLSLGTSSVDSSIRLKNISHCMKTDINLRFSSSNKVQIEKPIFTYVINYLSVLNNEIEI